MFGWLVGLSVVAIVVLSIGVQDSGDGADSGGWTKLLIGVVFLALAVKQWRSRPHEDAEPGMPA